MFSELLSLIPGFPLRKKLELLHTFGLDDILIIKFHIFGLEPDEKF